MHFKYMQFIVCRLYLIYLFFFKRNKLLIHTARQRNLKIIMLIEKKEDTKEYILHYSIYTLFWNRQHWTQKSHQWLLWRGGRGCLLKSIREFGGKWVQKFSTSSSWSWLYNCVHLSKLTKMCA